MTPARRAAVAVVQEGVLVVGGCGRTLPLVRHSGYRRGLRPQRAVPSGMRNQSGTGYNEYLYRPH